MLKRLATYALATLVASAAATFLLAWLIPPVATFVPTFLMISLLGLPGYLWLRHVERDSYGVAAALGFVLAPMPIGYLTWPVGPDGRVGATYVQGELVEKDGVPTLAGWINYAEFVLPIAVAGSVAALVFYRIVRSAR